MKHLKRYNESFDSSKFEWENPWEQTWPTVVKEIVRIRKKISNELFNLTTQPNNAQLEWHGKVLSLKRSYWEEKLYDLHRTEEIWDDLVPVVQDVGDSCNLEFKFFCIKEVGMENTRMGDFIGKEKDAAIFSFSWKIGQKVGKDKYNMAVVISQDISGTIDILNSIKDNLQRFGLDYRKDLQYRLSSQGSGDGYPEYHMLVKFQIKNPT